jgi:membrane-associated phospholipid phosphatase
LIIEPLGQLRGLDERLLVVARTWGHTPARERTVARFSRLGEHAGIWLAIGAAGAALDRSRRERWERAAGTVAATYALNTAIKLGVRRRRPRLAGLPPLTATPTKFSFPSAHASTSFAAALLYARLGIDAPALYALAGGMSLSRLYLGVHFPSDVLAGTALGAAIGAIAAGDGRRGSADGEGAA